MKPHPLFDSDWYLSQNPDVAAAGVNPLQHYMQHGWHEGRDPNPLFDTSFYLEKNPDVAQAGVNPLLHYSEYGWREGRDPHPEFDTAWYLKENPDVANAGNISPLAHYLAYGRQERRTPQPVQNEYQPHSFTGPSISGLDGNTGGDYLQRLGVALGARDPAYAPLASQATPIKRGEPSILAFYLPQFHPIPENDKWWGRGFTEWTNVSKAVAQFAGHYQPRLPGELGFYDLRLPDVMARQIELAKLYGLSGFCFHYYWFDGHRLLDRPIETLLASKGAEFDFPFCLCWANENWTRRWDGAEADVLMAQSHTPDDNARVFVDLMRYMSDPRYICVGGKPVVLIYRPLIIPEIAGMIDLWQDLARKNGLPGLYLVATNAFGFDDPKAIGFDAICQFPPHAVSIGEINDRLTFFNRGFEGRVYDYDEAVDAWLQTLELRDDRGQASEYFPGVMTGWDNEARRPGKGHVFHGATPAKFHRWLKAAVDWSRRNHEPGRRFVFVNAWNEWAEGTYLEPDRHYGYAYLAAVANVRAEALSNRSLSALADEIAVRRKKASDTAICLHIFYEDLIDEFAPAIASAKAAHNADVIVSIPDTWSTETATRLVQAIDPVRLVVSQNRGRDIYPFLQALRIGLGMGYRYGCKIHSKKSLHLDVGSRWRTDLLDDLMSPQATQVALALLRNDERVGLVAPAATFFPISNPDAMRDNWNHFNAILQKANATGIAPQDFVAGTMFWFRFSAFKAIAELPYTGDDFGPELGAIDGTLAHAFERAFPTLVGAAGFSSSGYGEKRKITPYKSGE